MIHLKKKGKENITLLLCLVLGLILSNAHFWLSYKNLIITIFEKVFKKIAISLIEDTL